MIYIESTNNTEILLFFKAENIERKSKSRLVEKIQVRFKYLLEEAYKPIPFGRDYKLGRISWNACPL